MELNELRLFDRSRVTTDWTCPRKRYLNYEYGGTGIVSSNTSLDLFMGTCLHDGLAAIAHQQLNGEINIDLIAEVARKAMFDSLSAESTGVMEEIDFALEQSSLLEGMLRGFYKQVWPRLISQYPKILFIEEEVLYAFNGLGFMSKPDLILSNEDESEIVYVEYKSTSSKSEGWVNGWETAVQLHSTVKAIKETKGIEVNKIIVQGLYKGIQSYGKQSSPFCYAYFRKGQPPFSEDQIEYKFKAGFKRTPIWERSGGVKSWIEGMPEEVLADQFPQVPPIFVNEDLVESFFKQRDSREHEIQLALDILNGREPEIIENILDVSFPQKFDSCSSYYGRDCEFKRICHGHVSNPLNEGWERRLPHHQPEVEQWASRSKVSVSEVN